MAIVPDNGSTADVNLLVRVGITGSGAIAGDIVRVYNGLALMATYTLLSGDISNDFADVPVSSLTNATYAFNATIQTSAGMSAHSAANYHVTETGGTPPPPPGGGGATLLFSDDFNSLDLKTDAHPLGVWMPNDFWQNVDRGYKDFAGTNWNANPNETAVNLNPFSISSSILTITSALIPSDRNAAIAASMAAQGQSGAPTWYGGMLITNPDVISFKYGYMEARMSFPTPGKGMFPAWWLYNARGGSKTSAEIDILEIFGNVGTIFHTSIHGSVSEEVPGSPNSGDTLGYHTYGMDWQPTYLRFYKDRVLLYEVTGTAASWFDVPMGLRLNFGMNAPWFPAMNMSDGSTPSSMRMLVDSVNVWNITPF